MTNFMAEGPGGGGEHYNREGLVRWANERFQAALPVDDVKNRPRNEIEGLLRETSQKFFVNGEVLQKADEYLHKAETHATATSPRRVRPTAPRRSTNWPAGPARTITSISMRRSSSRSTRRRPRTACCRLTTHGIARSWLRRSEP